MLISLISISLKNKSNSTSLVRIDFEDLNYVLFFKITDILVSSTD